MRGTPGAEFCDGLVRVGTDVVIQKGTLRAVDSYSGFGDAALGKFEQTALEAELRARGVMHLVVAGLALDFCVAFTALDARRLGFEVYLVKDGCRAVNAAGAERMLAVCAERGVVVVDTFADLPKDIFGGQAAAQ